MPRKPAVFSKHPTRYYCRRSLYTGIGVGGEQVPPSQASQMAWAYFLICCTVLTVEEKLYFSKGKNMTPKEDYDLCAATSAG